MLVKSCRSFSPKALGFCESTIITPRSSLRCSSGTAIELRMPVMMMDFDSEKRGSSLASLDKTATFSFTTWPTTARDTTSSSGPAFRAREQRGFSSPSSKRRMTPRSAESRSNERSRIFSISRSRSSSAPIARCSSYEMRSFS